MKFLNAARSALCIGVALCALQVTISHAQQGLPPRFELATAPLLAHESNPNSWPQPDYFDEALKLTNFRPGRRVTSLANSLNGAAASARFIVLPVQTQAFGFSPAFRATVGAQLDRQLESAGLAATRQTDIADAYGPFVRRLAETDIADVVRDHPHHKVIVTYLGHDGIDQAFVTLVVRDAQGQTQAHKVLALPDDAAAAEVAIVKLLPELLKGAGVTALGRPTASTSSPPTRCNDDAWSFIAATTELSPTQRACRALAIGTLLPSFARDHFSLSEESISAAKLAWLAQAHAYATSEAGAPELHRAIRSLAAAQLGVVAGIASTDLLPYRQAADPVLSRVARLLTLGLATRNAPTTSARDSRLRELDQIAEGLPGFAASLMRAGADLHDPFKQIDFCDIERTYPAALMRTSCRNEAVLPAPPRTRVASASEALLFQEWRLAWYHTELRYYGATQGNRGRTEEILRSLPEDVAQHPYIQRLRYELIDRQGAGGSFDDQLSRMREAARRAVQATVDLQRSDMWLAMHSLTDHSWTNNLNVMNDVQVRTIADAELRLVEVLRFDRFTSMLGLGGTPRKRKAGDKAYFLVMPAGQIRMLSMLASRPMPSPASAPPARSEPVPYKPRLFPARQEGPWAPTIPVMESALSSNPMDMGTRVGLAVARLKEGGSVSEARLLIDARQNDERSDHRVSESHAWAEPAHAFYFAGEPAAARTYYQHVTQIGTGSDSDLISQVRVELIDGRLRRARDLTSARLRRYDSDYARRDLVGLLFMLNKPDEAWATFMPRAASSEAFQLWLGAYTGHRIEGASLATMAQWLAQTGVDGAQIEYADVGDLYLHLQAVTDRVPTDADIALLGQPRGKRVYANRLSPASAMLIRSAMEGTRQQDSLAYAAAALAGRGGNQNDLFVLPAYTWVAWHATQGKDEVLADVRATPLSSGFDELLAKSLLLALEGQTAESLKYLTAARYGLSALGRGELVNRPIQAPYQFALAGHLMYQKTRDESYRRQTLGFVQAYQKVHPFLGWLYGMEALMDERPKERFVAACRAQYLDPLSHFLKLANVTGLSKSACASSLWK